MPPTRRTPIQHFGRRSRLSPKVQRNNFLLLSSPLTTAIGTYRGGIRLRCPPHDINIGQVLRETEDKLDVIGCLGRRDYCPIDRVCVLRGVLHDAIQAFLAVLDGYTLADLIKPQRALSLLLLDRHAARGP